MHTSWRQSPVDVTRLNTSSLLCHSTRSEISRKIKARILNEIPMHEDDISMHENDIFMNENNISLLENETFAPGVVFMHHIDISMHENDKFCPW